MNKLIFGRYIPGDSFIHRLDPRAKLLASFYFIGIIFLANNWQSYVLIAAFTAFAISLSKISARFFIRGVPTIIMANSVYCGSSNLVYTRGRGVLSVGNYFHYPVWCDEWAVYFLSFCFNYFHVNVINFNDGTIRVIRCD